MPEIWYAKKAILGLVDSGRTIDLLLNLHNTETAEYLDTQASDDVTRLRISRFFDNWSRAPRFRSRASRCGSTTGPTTRRIPSTVSGRIPVMLMEQRIGTSKKLGRRLTAEDRLAFGRQLITVMGQTVLDRPR